MTRRTTAAALAAVLCLSGLVALNPNQRAPAEPRKEARRAKPERSSDQMFRALTSEIDMKDFAQAPMKLKEALALLSEKLAVGFGGKDLPIVLDAAAFRTGKQAEQDCYELDVKFQPIPRRLPTFVVLHQILAQIPDKDATFVVRSNHIEITTRSAASLKSLLSQALMMRIEDRPLDEVLDDLADYSGASILLDPHAGEALKKRMSATFRNNTSVGTALYLLADMAGLKVVTLKDSVYITTPERARILQSEQERKQGPASLVSSAPQPGPMPPPLPQPKAIKGA